jgi:uncharacterized protein YrzB (UPF0473 family)
MNENQNEREFYTLVDEDGKELEFELIAQAKINEITYYAMIPADAAEQPDDGFCEYVILKEVMEDGEVTLVTVDDDDEFDDVADFFDNQFSEEIDYDGEK